MNHDLKYIIFFSILVLFVFILSEIVHRLFKVKVEYTRKTVHVICGLITLSYPNIFDHHLPVLILNSESLVLLILSKKFDFMPSINNVTRKTLGSFLYPVSIYIVFVGSLYFENKSFFYIPVLILAISDPIAGLSGFAYKSLSKKRNNIKYKEIKKTSKTIIGSAFFAFSTLIISLIMITIYYDFSFLKSFIMSIIITVVCTIVEAFSNKGLDNLTIPLAAMLLLIVFNL